MEKNDIEFDLSEMTIDDLVEFEEGDRDSVKFVRDFMGRFVRNGDGTILPPEKGIKLVGARKVVAIRDLQAKFEAAIKLLPMEGENPTMQGE